MRPERVEYSNNIPRLKEKPPKRKANRRFIFLFFFFFLLILLIIYLQSPLSKLNQIEITGNQLLQREQLLQQASLEVGMSYFNFRSAAVKMSLEEMIEIDQAQVERMLPNNLRIIVEEHPVVAFWLEDNQLHPVLSSGHILMNRPRPTININQPILNGWKNKDGLVELSKELDNLPQSVRSQISEIILTPTISDPYRLKLYMVDDFEVITSIRNFAENMNLYPHYVQLARKEGNEGGIFYLLDGKWYENPLLQDETE